MAKKALLMILDGWGIGQHGEGDVIYRTPTPYLDYLTAISAHSQLHASGEDVGLPDGQMGNSEVGHLNIGAGRVVYQDLVKINRACKDGSILKNPQVVAAYSYAKEQGKKLHLMGRRRSFQPPTPLQTHRNRQGIWAERPSIRTLFHGRTRHRPTLGQGFH